MARQFINTYLPRHARKGQKISFLHSSVIGDGGVAVTPSGETTVIIDSPYVRGYIEGISFRGTVAAVSASGTVLVTVYKRDVANDTAVALNTPFSLEANGLTTLDAAIQASLLTTLTDAERTKLEADTFYAVIESTAAIGTAPVLVQITVALAETR